MPQSTDTSVSIRKGMDQFQFIVKNTTSDKHMQITVFYPFKKFCNQSRYILRKCSEMQDVPFRIHNTHRM